MNPSGRDQRTVVIAVAALVVAVALAAARVSGGDGIVTATCDDPIVWSAATSHAGQRAAVVGQVAAVTFVPVVGGQPTFINLGNAHPDPDRFDVVVYREVNDRLADPVTTSLVDETICVIGTIRLRDNVPQVIVGHPAALRRLPAAGSGR